MDDLEASRWLAAKAEAYVTSKVMVQTLAELERGTGPVSQRLAYSHFKLSSSVSPLAIVAAGKRSRCASSSMSATLPGRQSRAGISAAWRGCSTTT